MELNNCGFRVANQVVNQRVTYDDAEGHCIGVVTTVLGEYTTWHRKVMVDSLLAVMAGYLKNEILVSRPYYAAPANEFLITPNELLCVL